MLTRFGSVSGPENAGILLAQVKNTVADAWFEPRANRLPKCRSELILQQAGLFCIARNAAPHHEGRHRAAPAPVNNVLAYLPGKTDEYVIIGAHYDHLGLGDSNSLAPSLIGQIHPGADDNASGTAGVLELARCSRAAQGPTQRGILFLSFAGEELGLLGSADWVNHPDAAARQRRRHDQHGHDRPHQRRQGLYRRRRHGIDVPEGARRRPTASSTFKLESSPSGYRLERPHLVRHQAAFPCCSFSPACTRTITSLRIPGTRSMRPLRRSC